MANPAPLDVSQNPNQQDQNTKLRASLNDAYAALEGAKTVQSFAALTYEDLIDQQIERISGKGTATRPNELERVQKVLANVTTAVAQIKKLPDNAFARNDQENNVNTTP